ncbi:MAG: zinc ribbon domain-containing protein [Actinocrinis sp.]
MFFLIWGFKVRFKLLSSGTFFCPNCGGDRPYDLRQARRWFHLYYIPLFPTSVLGEQVRCGVCKTSYNQSVLNRPTSGQLSTLLVDAARGVIVHVLRAGSSQSADARAVAVAEVGRAGLPAYTDESLETDLGVVPGDLSQLLSALGTQLADTGKESLVGAAAKVALADGPLTDLERQVLVSTGASLGMTATHTAGVISLAEQATRA